MNNKASKKTRPLRATDEQWEAIRKQARRWAKANGLSGHKASVSAYLRHAAMNYQ